MKNVQGKFKENLKKVSEKLKFSGKFKGNSKRNSDNIYTELKKNFKVT